MRYYLGVDWADQTHAVWVVDEQGTKVASRAVPHTAAGLSEWGSELDEWQAQGIELWAAIERPEGRVVDFLLDHRVVVYPVNRLVNSTSGGKPAGARPSLRAPPRVQSAGRPSVTRALTSITSPGSTGSPRSACAATP